MEFDFKWKNYPITIRSYVQKEVIFDVIYDVHLTVGNGRQNATRMETQTKYKNIIAETIMLYLRLYIGCCKIPAKERVSGQTYDIQWN